MNVDFRRDSIGSSIEELDYLAQPSLAFPALAAIFMLLICLISTPRHYSMLYIDFRTSTPAMDTIHVSVDIDFDGAVFINGQLAVNRTAYETELKKLSARYPQPEVWVYAHPFVNLRHIAAFVSSSQSAGLKRTVLMDCESAYCAEKALPYVTF